MTGVVNFIFTGTPLFQEMLLCNHFLHLVPHENKIYDSCHRLLNFPVILLMYVAKN